MIQGRKRSGFSENRKAYQAPKSEWIIVRNTHPALVEEALFHTVQAIAEERRSAYQARLGCHDGLGMIPNLLRGLVFCADCGRPLVRYKSVTGGGKYLAYVYICQSHSDDLDSCPKKYFHETRLEALLWDTLRQEISLAGDLEQAVRRYSRSLGVQRRESAFEQELAAARRTLARAGRLYDSLYQNYADRLMTEQEYTELKRQYRAEQESAQARVEELEAQRQEERQQTVDNPWLAACSRFSAETGLTSDMAHALIERVEVDGENHVHVILRYRDEYRTLLRRLEEGREVAAL